MKIHGNDKGGIRGHVQLASVAGWGGGTSGLKWILGRRCSPWWRWQIFSLLWKGWDFPRFFGRLHRFVTLTIDGIHCKLLFKNPTERRAPSVNPPGGRDRFSRKRQAQGRQAAGGCKNLSFVYGNLDGVYATGTNSIPFFVVFPRRWSNFSILMHFWCGRYYKMVISLLLWRTAFYGNYWTLDCEGIHFGKIII